MSQPTSVAASLSPGSRKSLAIEVLSQAEPTSHLAAQHQVSRKFLYQQRQKAFRGARGSFQFRQKRARSAVLAAGNADMVVPVDVGANPDLPLF